MRLAACALLFTLLVACNAAPYPPAAAPTAPSASGAAPSAAAGRVAQAVAEARRILRRRIAAGVPGISAAVARGGKVLWSEGFGYADIAARRPITATTQLRIGSVAKPITSVALGQLVERGALDLDAPVQTYVPTFPRKEYPISTRQLAGHLACIRHYKGDEVLNTRHYDTLVAGFAMFQDDPLLCVPGSRFNYSSYGWNLVGAVIEGASGEDYLGYMKKHVFDPLGMTHTVPDMAGAPNPERTEFYSIDESRKVTVARVVDNSYKWPSGGLLSTAEDLLKLGSAMLAPGFLKASTRELLLLPLRARDGESTNYGLGWSVGRQLGHLRFWHTGGSVGGTTFFAIYPDEGLVVAVIANMGDADELGAEAVAEAFLDLGAP